ncbi:hypothetical protein O1611_g7557 [Lasiodiplodia mahajangana]|uniref:Uncharacterized protein n=1 Tax=Lasiodiplodia mahajangana TaxID=1108764 RepID=A0ACC2JEY3_9PEZI|nr:hypothetical protein O1611_g7557 [Lasiodiplodia mahajangana]
MAHGFERLERLFTGSRRRERERRKAAQQQKTSMITSQRPPSPIFPSPPYLKPTSTHMTPRDAQIDGPGTDKGRSQSVPTLQEALYRRSSGTSSITIVNRPSRSDASTPSLRRRSKNSQTTSRPSRFRFPEDSLFRNHRTIRKSGDFGRTYALQEQSPRSSATKPQGLLDWTPKHISLLFNPLDFNAAPSDSVLEPGSDKRKSTLLPSPDFVPSMSSSEIHGSLEHPSQSIIAHPSPISRNSIQKPALSTIQQHLLSYGKPDSTPTSDSVDENRKLGVHRSVSLNGVALSRPNNTHATPIPSSTSTKPSFTRRRSVRETWGNRLEDPQFNPLPTSNSDDTLKPNLRKSASTSTLSVLTFQISKEDILKEPTFDDFYALSDDDIAESRPPTPAYDADPPATSPTKKTPNTRFRSRLPRPITSPHATFKLTHGEITPPDTPTDSRLLSLTLSPSSPRDTIGALWAAELARKYNFAVLYVLSLWPVGGDCCMDDLNYTLTSEPRPATAPAAERFAAPAEGSKIRGRLLAAYGLNQVPSPFEIATDTHLSALDCDHWNEYRNVDARPDDISRGWIRTFYGEYAHVLTGTTRRPPNNHPKNRGIVFAAYSKQTPNPVIPMSTSPRQELLLRQLYSDAKTLVEALVQQPDGSNRTSTVYQD